MAMEKITENGVAIALVTGTCALTDEQTALDLIMEARYTLGAERIAIEKAAVWGTLRKEGAPRLLYLKLKIVVLKRYSLSAMPFLLCCVPVLLNALGTLLPFLRD